MSRNVLFSACVAGAALAPLPSYSALNTINSLASFNRTNGSGPRGGLTTGTGGLFYGTTLGGGANDRGTVYSFNSNTNVITSLASFNVTNGSGPRAGLTAGSGGLFYGNTGTGGVNRVGTVYSFNSNTNAITSFASFNTTNGAFPQAGLTAGAGGLFYGTTFGGGANGQGTVYSFNSVTNTITAFSGFNSTNGSSPFAGLTAGAGGLFYGTTDFGGVNGVGTVYSFNSITNAITGLASFNTTTGSDTAGAGLTAGAGGLLFGTTVNGGVNGLGAVYSFNSITNTITTLASFNGTNGSDPRAGLTAGVGGLFYGTTRSGGVNGVGTVYSFNSITNAITTLASFNGTNGSLPLGRLTAGLNDIFYGTTSAGGENGQGTVFSIQVPGPLPILGAGMAFGWSRRIRKRIRAARLD